VGRFADSPCLSGFSNDSERRRNLRSALAWRRSGVRVPSGPLRKGSVLQVKRRERMTSSREFRPLYSNPRKCLHLQALCTLQRRPANYHTSFTEQRLLVRSQHRPLLKPHFAGKTQVQGGDRDLHSTNLHQSDNRGLYVGWRRAGARSGGWAGALRAGGFGIGRVTGSSDARVTVAPWCATSSGAPWSKV
jgi:hypothetical protein